MTEIVTTNDGLPHEVGISAVAECFDCGATATAATADGAKRLLVHGKHRFEKDVPPGMDFGVPRRLMTEDEMRRDGHIS